MATCCASATGVDWSNSPFRTSTGIDGRAPPPGNGGGPIRGCGQSRQPRTSSRSTTVRSQTRFENGANTFGERCRMAFARVARRRAGGSAFDHDRRIVMAGDRQVVAHRVGAGASPRKVERHVLGGQAEHRRPVAVAERHERARQVAEDGVGVGRVVDQVAELDRPEPDVPAHAVGVRPGPGDRVRGEPACQRPDRPQDVRALRPRGRTPRARPRAARPTTPRSNGSNELSKAASTTTARVLFGCRTANTWAA